MPGGSCLCGDVAFELAGGLEDLAHCHCGICRKAHGAAFATWTAAPAERLRWRRGEAGLRRYESSPGFLRPFCARCGSKLPIVAGDRCYAPAGNLEGDPGVRPAAHLFVGSKAPWHEIADALPRFDALPEGSAAPRPPERPRAPSDAERLRGSCLCGEVRYEADGGLPFLRNCHCSRCRKARSAAHATNGFVPLDRFRFTRGAGRVRQFKVPDARFFMQCFCDACGAPVPRVDEQRAIAVIPAGSIDGDPGVRESGHIFVASRAPWFEIADALPQYPEAMPA